MKKFPVIFRFTGIFFAYLQKSADSLGRFLKKRTIRLNWAFPVTTAPKPSRTQAFSKQPSLQKICLNDLIHLLRTEWMLVCLIGCDQLNRWNNPMLTIDLKLMTVFSDIAGVIHHAKMLPIEDLSCLRVTYGEVWEKRILSKLKQTFIPIGYPV